MQQVFSKQEGKNSLLGYPISNHSVYFENAGSQFFVLYCIDHFDIFGIFDINFQYHSFGIGPWYIILWFC